MSMTNDEIIYSVVELIAPCLNMYDLMNLGISCKKLHIAINNYVPFQESLNVLRLKKEKKKESRIKYRRELRNHIIMRIILFFGICSLMLVFFMVVFSDFW